MVGVFDVGKDVNGLDAVFEYIGNDMIINAPAEIFLAGVGAIAPPTVAIGFFHEMAKTVDVAIAEEISKPRAFLRQESRRGDMRLGIVDVDGLVADVVIARKHQLRTLFAQCVHIIAEKIKPLHLESLPVVAGRARWVIDTHYRQVAEIGTKETTFSIVKRIVHAIDHIVRMLLANHANAAVAFFLCRKPKMMVAHHLEIHQWNLVGRGFQFLKTQHVGLTLFNPLQQPLADGGADAIHVITDDFHIQVQIRMRKYEFFGTSDKRISYFSGLKHEVLLKDKIKTWIDQFNEWRAARISDRVFMILLSIPTGFCAGLAAVIIKKLAHGIRDFVLNMQFNHSHLLYIICPAIGIFLTILFCKFILRKDVGHGIPGILVAISKKKGEVSRSGMWSSIFTSALTVGFGGSVGLEGPSVSTGASIGSNIGQMLKLDYKKIVLLIGMGAASALASIFQAPITGVVFALEVLMIDLSLSALIPIIVSSFVAILTSYFVLGQAVEYPASIAEGFIPSNALYYVGLGLFAGLVSAYFLKVTFMVEKSFKRVESPWKRFFVGAIFLGVLIYFFPALYGEGYEAVNSALRGDYSAVFGNSMFEPFKDREWVVLALFAGIILLKAFATAFTFGAGGVGGTFAPALFLGAFTGLFFASTVNYLGIGDLDTGKFALVGMSGLIAGMLHAPLTGIFLIAEITNGYALIVPLMIVAALSYAINHLFFKHSIYTQSVFEQGIEVSHNKDRNVLNMMAVNQLIETNFNSIDPDKTLRDLIPLIASSKRNIFPVVDKKGNFCGHVLFDDIRSIMFDESYYSRYISDFTVIPEYVIRPDDPMEDIVRKFQKSGKYNIPVVKDNKYLGYISRANVFSAYRNTMSEISDD